jgi:hypothetical protein
LRLPEAGPTGRFANGLRAWVMYSDAAGIARFPLILWGDTPGAVPVRLTAAKGTLHTGLVINQQITVEAKSVMIVPVPAKTASTAEPKPARPPQLKTSVETPLPGKEPAALADVIPADSTHQVNRTTTGAEPPHPLKPNPPAGKETEPAVSITNSSSGAGHEKHKMLYTLLAVGAGAGVGTIFALKGHGGTSSSGGAAAGVSIGAPSVTIGH